ncbi:MAG: hypothetical protein EBV06_06230 [Planctomycetia bacterium]|nr:hypothetical protein [Planctomycetia bacterium]
MTLHAALFYILATVTAISAIGVAVTSNIVRAATWLLFALASTAGIYFLLGADFLGATQLIVYVGGTMILVVFGVMLTASGPFVNMKVGAAEWAISLAVGLLLYSVLAIVLLQIEPPSRNIPPNHTLLPSKHIGAALLGSSSSTPEAKVTGLRGGQFIPRTRVSYLLPFEIISVHLLVVLIGAAYLARAKRRREDVA